MVFIYKYFWNPKLKIYTIIKIKPFNHHGCIKLNINLTPETTSCNKLHSNLSEVRFKGTELFPNIGVLKIGGFKI